MPDWVVIDDEYKAFARTGGVLDTPSGLEPHRPQTGLESTHEDVFLERTGTKLVETSKSEA